MAQLGALLLGALLGVVVGQAAAATFRVRNLNDSGPGSLRQAILDANATPGADGIRFASGVRGTLTLTGWGLSITDDLTIRGSGERWCGQHAPRPEERVSSVATRCVALQGREGAEGRIPIASHAHSTGLEKRASALSRDVSYRQGVGYGAAVPRMLISAAEVQGLPSISESAMRLTKRPTVPGNITVVSVRPPANIPLATGSPQSRPSSLT